MNKEEKENYKLALIDKLDELKAKMEKTDEEYQAEIVEYAKKYSDNLDSKAAELEMQKLGKKYAEIFANEEDEIKVIEGMLTQLNNESFHE